MGVDESFRQPGSVPFKWEIRPGVPKVQHQHQHQHQHRHRQQPGHHPPPKLRPPPSSPRFDAPPQHDLRTGSFRSAPRARSDRWIFDRPEVVSVGCFAGPLKNNRKDSSKKRIVKSPEPMFSSRIEMTARRPSSFRITRLPFQASQVSSYESSPRPSNDTEWAGFGLF